MAPDRPHPSQHVTAPAGAGPGAGSGEGPGEGWHAVAASADVADRPLAVDVEGEAYVAFRPGPGAPVTVLPDRCPHRLVRLSHGTVVPAGERAGERAGALQCPYHGWRFDAAGRCLAVPSAGEDAAVPPRAHLTPPWGVREEGGLVWVAPRAPDVPRSGGITAARFPTTGELLTNARPGLDAGWHPLTLVDELPDDGTPRTALLLGRRWTVARGSAGPDVRAESGPAPAAVAERFGLVWVAPRPPVTGLVEAPDDADPRFAGAWLPPARSASAAAVLAENFLDVAHFPFVHAGTFGAGEERHVPPFDVVTGPHGLSSVQEQWFDNPHDPGVAAGVRPVRQRRRATYTYRVPFQLTLRLEELDAGAVKTILFLLQPEGEGSTRIYTKMVLHGIGGVARPGPDVVAAEVAFEEAVLAEDLALQRAMTAGGLPLRLRDELHVRSDRSGVALRRVLRRFVGLDGPARPDGPAGYVGPAR